MNNEQNPDRRRILKIAIGAGAVTALGIALPAKWTRPVIESVVMPEHAHASAAAPTTSG